MLPPLGTRLTVLKDGSPRLDWRQYGIVHVRLFAFNQTSRKNEYSPWQHGRIVNEYLGISTASNRYTFYLVRIEAPGSGQHGQKWLCSPQLGQVWFPDAVEPPSHSEALVMKYLTLHTTYAGVPSKILRGHDVVEALVFYKCCYQRHDEWTFMERPYRAVKMEKVPGNGGPLPIFPYNAETAKALVSVGYNVFGCNIPVTAVAAIPVEAKAPEAEAGEARPGEE